MFHGCPAGGMNHRFDKTTHRCRCGRWQAGFAPKKEAVKPRCECQICERKQACDKDGTLGHHGYKRPGWGFIHGDCMGEGYAPYPATDALEAYLTALQGYLARCREALAKLPERESLPYSFLADAEYGKPRRERRETTVQVPRGGEYKQSPRHCGTSFSALEAREQRRLDMEISNGTQERKRVTARIAKAKEMVAA